MTTKRSKPKKSKPADALTMVERVDQRLQAAGLHMPHRPEFGEKDLRVPSDITTLHPQALGQLYSRYARLCEYVHGFVGRLELEFRAAEEAYRSAKDRALIAVDPSVKSVAERKAVAETVPDTTAARQHLAESEGTLKNAQQLLEGYRTQLAALSREVTRRDRLTVLAQGDEVLDRRRGFGGQKPV